MQNCCGYGKERYYDNRVRGGKRRLVFNCVLTIFRQFFDGLFLFGFTFARILGLSTDFSAGTIFRTIRSLSVSSQEMCAKQESLTFRPSRSDKNRSEDCHYCSEEVSEERQTVEKVFYHTTGEQYNNTTGEQIARQ